MRSVYGIGLPRTGTASLAEALNLIGEPTKHYCVVHDDMSKCHDDIISWVDNSFYRYLHQIILKPIPNSLFILTTRDLNSWKKSIARFPEMPSDLPPVNEYEKSVRQIFQQLKMQDQLLVINIFEDPDSLKKIVKFIGSEYKKTKFPHIKKEKVQVVV